MTFEIKYENYTYLLTQAKTTKTPPKAVKQFQLKIFCFHYTRLQSISKHSKVEDRCIFNIIRFDKRALII